MEVGIAFHVGAGRAGICPFGAREAHAEMQVDDFADLVFGDQLLGIICRLREIVVQIDAEIEIVLGGEGDHLAGLFDVVGDWLFAEDMLAGREGLHDGNAVPTAVFRTARADIDDVELFVGEHVVQAVVCLDLQFCG